MIACGFVNVIGCYYIIWNYCINGYNTGCSVLRGGIRSAQCISSIYAPVEKKRRLVV